MMFFVATPDFVKSLNKLNEKIKEQIKEKLTFLSSIENPIQFSKKLIGYKNIFRFRSGDYRIVFRLEKQKIILLLVKHRKEIYEGL